MADGCAHPVRVWVSHDGMVRCDACATLLTAADVGEERLLFFILACARAQHPHKGVVWDKMFGPDFALAGAHAMAVLGRVDLRCLCVMSEELHRLDAVGWVTDPTGYRAAMGNIPKVQRLVSALMELRAAVRAVDGLDG